MVPDTNKSIFEGQQSLQFHILHIMTIYYKMRQVLLQNATRIYFEMRQVFYYKMRQFYYKVWILLQSATFIKKCKQI